MVMYVAGVLPMGVLDAETLAPRHGAVESYLSELRMAVRIARPEASLWEAACWVVSTDKPTCAHSLCR